MSVQFVKFQELVPPRSGAVESHLQHSYSKISYATTIVKLYYNKKSRYLCASEYLETIIKNEILENFFT